jgi:serine/threonine protein kinase
MGEVYRARDVQSRREVALKMLLATGELEANRLTRFMREARVLASLSHPNIALIYDAQVFELGPVLILEFVEGPTLADRIASGVVPLTTSLSIASQLAAALEAAHANGVIHRDLKPANIMLTVGGMVKLVDFGVATTIADEITQLVSPATAPHGLATDAEVIVGTPSYMSPEQTRGECVDQRADIWAFGCVLYELLTGERAFSGATPVDTFAAVREREPDLRRLPSRLPACTRDLLRACLEKDVDRRLRTIVRARTAIEEARRALASGSSRWRAA